jgi:hypothetical protein
MIDELWRPIPGYEQFYQVSNLGRVKSLSRGARTGYGRYRTVKERILIPSSWGGYPRVTLSENNRPRVYLVHRLVLLAFVGPCPEGMEARHLNGDSKDNRLDNLAWGTLDENQADRVIHGTHIRGERNWLHILTATQILIFVNKSRTGHAELRTDWLKSSGYRPRSSQRSSVGKAGSISISDLRLRRTT